jgi:hypothetical protein
MKRLLALSVGAMLMMAAMSPPSTKAVDTDGVLIVCPGYELFLYEGEYREGLQELHVCYGTNYNNLHLIGWGDRAESLDLGHAAAGQGIRLYRDINMSGPYLRICGNTYRPTLGTWKDTISSLLWINSCPV